MSVPLAKKTNVTVGLFPQGGERWIAGAIYLQNLIRGLKLLPGEQQPDLHFIYHHGADLSVQQELGPFLPPRHSYSHRHNSTRRYKLRAVFRSLKNRHWPISFEALVLRLRISAMFPLQWSLGPQFPVPWIGWIPDFQHKRLPRFFDEMECRERDERFFQLIREASHVVVSSQDAYHDLMRWFPADPQRVSILRFSMIPAHEWFEQSPAGIVKKYQLPEKFVMFPSQFWLHKNHKVLLNAFAILKRQGIADAAVVFSGFKKDYRHPHFFDTVEAMMKQLGIENNVHMLGLLPRHEQIQLMRQAAAIIQPSYFEGWSSLVEDCRSLGKTIYMSDIPVHREQDPGYAQFFNPDSAEELADLIKRDWPQLAPGPDEKREEQAIRDTQERGAAYASQFLSIVERLGRF
jgi:glycosyltransferase involved in cell wall biosynthesis